ncbi:hypothetical protein FQZ97_804840 [compost metagenome]
MQFLAVVGFNAHQATSAALQQLAGRGVVAQETLSFGVDNAQTLQQALRRVVAPRHFAAEQHEVGGGGTEQACRSECGGVEGFDDLAHGEVGGVGCERRDTEGGDASAQQQRADAAHDAAGVPGEALTGGVGDLGQRVEQRADQNRCFLGKVPTVRWMAHTG